MAWLGRVPLAGAAITTIALLGIWDVNTKRLGFESAWPTIVAGIAIALLVVASLRPVAGSWARAGLISALVAIYIFYAPALLSLLPLPSGGLVFAHAAVICLLIHVAGKIPRGGEALRDLSARFNLLCLLLLSFNAIPVGVKLASLEGPRRQAQQALPQFQGRATTASPDVWHIIFDRYAGADTLRTVYRFDNQQFIDQLRRRGFAVPDQAFSNYHRTGHSVASTMNGALLDSMSHAMRDQPEDWVPIYRAMRDHAAIRFFDRQGYRTYFAGSWWEPTRFSSVADESIEIRSLPQLARLAIDTSSIGGWLRSFDIPYFNGRADQCFRAGEKFRRLKQVAREDGRKYVFAHFLVPHPPFVLNADGSCRRLEQARKASRRHNYVAQIQFANREALELVDAILAGPRPAIIIIHGDEGPWPEPHVGNEHGLGTDPVDVDWNALPPAKLREKMSTLIAVRAPNGPPARVPSSPVQIYPIILQEHFGSRAPVPESRSFLFESNDQLYRFHDVSGRLRQSAGD
jgi:hypothetical protein